MKTPFSLFVVALLALLAACGDSHFISDKKIREQVEKDFDLKKQQLRAGKLFAEFEQHMSLMEREALTFLYAYMPLSDIANHGAEYHQRNMRTAFRTRTEFPWGGKVPEKLFRHFVLPVRVNNETLDDFRQVYYRELKERVAGMSMYDAVLEINHWCHEKVIYAPSDPRTSSPLATIRSAYGRCGEESVLLVSALRTIGIPARQVYTPRWAHTDSNHAWVEAWVDGDWYFLGACEPEPVLNLGWFNAPASRGMLMHAKVFGRYYGEEEIMSETPCYTEINVIGNYASSARAIVQVVDTDGQPVEDARVDFRIYNYAEFYTIASRNTDSRGITSLTAGKGDVLVWASKGGKFGYARLSFGKQDKISIVLDRKEGEAYTLSLDFTPPDENATIVEVTTEQRAENDRRMAEEDAIRNKYTATFMDREKALAAAGNFAPDTAGLANLLMASRGNHGEIVNFLKNVLTDRRQDALQLLKHLSEKDLRDASALILVDHLIHTSFEDSPYYYAYVQNPRIGYEGLSTYRSYFQQHLEKDFQEQIKQNPEIWVEWCKQNITVNDELNGLNYPITPEGVWRIKVADSHSRNIFFVAVLRSVGVPARIDPVTGRTQYIQDNEWISADFGDVSSVLANKGMVSLDYMPSNSLKNPFYQSHFTLSKFDNGTFRTLGFPRDESGSWENMFKNPVSLEEGYYMLLTGTRLAKGGVLTNVTFFNVVPRELVTVNLQMRDNPDEVQVIGSFDSEVTFLPQGKEQEQSILQTSGRGYFIVAVLAPGQEPTNHALRDIAALKNDFEAWERSLVFLFTDSQKMKSFNPDEFPGLPSTITYGVDTEGKIQQLLKENDAITGSNLPIFIIGDTFNRIVFVSEGYTIGLGEQLMKVINKL